MRLPRIAPLLLLVTVSAALSVACGDDPVPAPAPRSDTPTPEPSQVENDNEGEVTFDPANVRIETRPVLDGFESPVGVTHAGDDSGRLFVIEQVGRIQVIEGERAETFLDIGDRLVSGGEQGLLGLAFHPRYEANKRFYVNYTDLDGDTVVSEFESTEDGGDPSSERVLLRIDQPFENHNGGHLAFGPDGYLYIATGDGGSAGDPENNGQRLDTHLGKLLRIDVDSRAAGQYGIPKDNPFTDDPDARPEIWAYGLRNPWRFSFDRETDELWIGDVGQSATEEIDREPAGSRGGRNYGWRLVEGNDCYEDDCDPSRFVPPVATYSHELGCSVTGGYVYRGDAYPALRGAYIAGDYCSGYIWALPANVNGVEDPEPALATDLSISSFGEDEAGEIYLTDGATGSLHQIVLSND